jgi:WD40 repeat protein/serine/threonine protein kinase
MTDPFSPRISHYLIDESASHSMNEPRQREETLFEAAVALPSEQRARYLEKACGDDMPLRQRVEALLKAHDQAGEFLVDAPGSASAKTFVVSTAMVSVPEGPGDRIGHYKLRENLGEGGCGVVYVAEQEEPVRRRVALKVIKLGMDTRQVVARFEAERQALAMMDHPNIAKVFDAGTTGTGRPFFVMELVRGIRVTDYCDQNNLSTRERLDLFIKICQAIQHAHQKGIIHRDIKPSNILVTLHDGVPVPKVIDFGIAKATEGRLTDATVYTQLHQFIGTPAYMSPEQAEMSGLDIDTRSDIYSLGVLLYELLAGSTPFDARELVASGIDTMRKTIREREPVRPSTRLATLQGEELTTTARRRSTDAPKLVHLLKGDLDWIVMKCLEKDRTRRYESASGLAADLKRHLSNEPITARPPSSAYRFQKAFRRNKLAFSAAGSVVLALLLGLITTQRQAIRAMKAEREQAKLREAAEKVTALEAASRQAATRAKSEAEVERDHARRNLYAADINLAHQAWLQSNLGKARRLLVSTTPQADQEDLRGWEWRYLWGLTRGDDTAEIARFNGGVFHLAFVDNDRSVAVGLTGFGSEESGNLLFDVGTTRLTNRRVFGRGQLAVSAYFPAKKWLLSSLVDSNRWGVSVLNASTLEEITQLPASSFVRALSVSRDGNRLAVYQGGGKAGVNVWRTDDWSHISITGGSGGVHAGGVGFLGTGDRIVIGWGDGKLSVHDSVTGDKLREFAAHTDGITAMAIAPTFRVVATGAGFTERTIKLWNPENGEAVGELSGHQAWICGLAFSPDGALLASASADQTIRLWDTKTWIEVATLRSHEDEVYSLAFSTDGRRLITGAKDGSVRLWQIPPAERLPALRALPEPCQNFAISPDERRLVTVGDNYALWDLDTGEKLATLTELRGYRGGCDFSPDGRQLLVGGRKGKIRIWDFERSSLSEFDAGHDEDVAGVKILGVTNFLLAAWWGPAERLKIWNFETRQIVHEFEWSGRQISEGNFSRRGDFALGHDDGSVTVWNAESRWAQTDFPAHRRAVSGLAFTPDGRTLATGGVEGTAKLWNLATQREILTLKGHLKSVHALDISPDGNRLATGGGGAESVKLWDMHTHQELITLAGEGSIMVALAFSPDGNKIIGWNDQRLLQIWRAPSWEEIKTAEARDKKEPRTP